MTITSIHQQVNTLIASNWCASFGTIMDNSNLAPHNSWVPYVQTNDGSVILLLSDIAQHTKNCKKNNNVSLLITSNTHASEPNIPRICLHGSIAPIDNNSEVVARYCRYYKRANEYIETLDFNFYQLTAKKIQAVLGFGMVQWLDAREIDKSPFNEQEEINMIDHMNADHADAIRHYCDKMAIEIVPIGTPTIVGINKYGFHVEAPEQIYWFPFETPCESVTSVRKALIAMAQS